MFAMKVETLNPLESLTVSSERLAQLQKATEQDTGLQTLKTTMLVGWPEQKSHVPIPIRDYWNYRDEISLHNGILFKRQRIIIPKTIRPEIIARSQSSHLGIESCLRKARDSVFWPGISSEIKEAVSQSSVCAESVQVIWRELKSSNRTNVTPGSDDNKETSQQDFKASNGWVVHFMNRHGLTLRKSTSLAPHNPGNLIDRMISFILNVRRKFHTKQYAMASVITMDETLLWLDMQSATTVNEAGASSVTIRSTGREKDRVTVCLAAKANGHKLKPFIVFQRWKKRCKENE